MNPSGTGLDGKIKQFEYTADTSPPAETVRLCFIHHSVGTNWLKATGDNSGNLGMMLNGNNYWVTDATYDWGPVVPSYNEQLGELTDTVHWPLWFSGTYAPYVFENIDHKAYYNSSSLAEPSGENEIIIFKSCYPNSVVGNSIEDEKAIYDSLLGFFSANRDKMFVLVTPPPQIQIDNASLTRELTLWLMNRDEGWLQDYPYDNVYAFDLYNVLTDPRNHHRIDAMDREQHIVSSTPLDASHPDELYYHADGDDHPTTAGMLKAADEFIELLNAWYHLWKN